MIKKDIKIKDDSSRAEMNTLCEGTHTELKGNPPTGLILTIVHYFLAGPIFLHINTLARPAGSTQSRSENQSMRASAVGSGGELKFFLINSGLRWLGWEGAPLCRDNLFHIDGVQRVGFSLLKTISSMWAVSSKAIFWTSQFNIAQFLF